MRSDDAHWARRDREVREALRTIGVTEERITEIEEYAADDSDFFHDFVLHILNHYEPPVDLEEERL